MKNEEIAVKIILSGWKKGQEEIQKALLTLSDDSMDRKLMPSKNKVSWVIGHLAAVNDSLFTFFGLGTKINENYHDYFTKDDSLIKAPSISQTREYWKETSERLNEAIAKLSVQDWFERHTAISAEDFAKEPHRNKLNVLLSRTFHLNHHSGQLALVLKSVTHN